MKRIEQKVLKFIDDKNLIEKNDKILVGLSGGPDSVSLLYILNKYSQKLKISLGVLHINHRLRGKDADNDEQFCKEFSESLGIEFYSVRKNIKAIASKKKLSLEETGRLVRYNEFEKILVKKAFTKIATAHNADENSETVLLNLVKGTGLSGISGIPPVRDNIIRPILCLTKKEILDYLNYHKLKYRTDLTNFKDDAERNFLRNQVIPLIQKRLNPSLSNTLLKSSEIFRNINNLLKKRIYESAENLVTKKKDHIVISLKKFNKIEGEYSSEVLRLIFDREFGIKLTFDDCSKIISLMNKQTGKSIDIYNRIKIYKEREELIIAKENSEVKSGSIIFEEGDSVKIDGKELLVKEIGTMKQKISSNKNLEFISADNTGKNFLVRKWMPGDRFFPFGMRGSKKISDFLSEQKLPSIRKKNQMLLLNKDRIVWVIGLRLDERFRVTSGTKRIFQLCLS